MIRRERDRERNSRGRESDRAREGKILGERKREKDREIFIILMFKFFLKVLENLENESSQNQYHSINILDKSISLNVLTCYSLMKTQKYFLKHRNYQFNHLKS